MSIDSRHTRVRVEQEHFIPVSKKHLVETLLNEIDDADQRRQFESFCHLIEATYHFEYHRMSQELKHDFQFFDPDSGNGEIRQLTVPQIEQVEDRFLGNFMRLMEKANFRLLSQADIDVAEADEYLFSLPVEVDWEQLDRQMLGRFLQSHSKANGGEPHPPFADKILIFHRGVGVDTTQGLLILQKIDYLMTGLLERIIRPFSRVFRPDRETRPDPGEQVANQSETIVEDDTDFADSCSDSVFEDRYIDRINLQSTGVGFQSLFKKTSLQEPTFKELVILFRFAPPPVAEAAEADPEDYRKLFVKAFRDIPMADLEVVYPAKRISMGLVDLVKLLVIGAVGVVVVVFKLVFTAVLNPLLLLAALISVGGYAGKIFAGFKAAKDRYHNLVTQSLYHKNLDNDLGVMLYVVDALEEQEFNEAVLAYFILLDNGKMTEKQLDASCERYLEQHFGVEVNFEVHDALAKLVNQKIVTQTTDHYRAIPLEIAIDQLNCNWDNFF